MDETQTLEAKREFFRDQFDKVDRGDIQTMDSKPETKIIDKEVMEAPVVKTKAEANSEEHESVKEEKPEKTQEVKEESDSKEYFPKHKIIESKEVSKEKDKERFDRNWKKFEQDKETFKKERAEFDTQLKNHREQVEKQVREEYKKKRPDVVSITPETYMQMAEDAKANGDYDKADEYRAQAYQLKEELKSFQEEENKSKQDQEQYQTKLANHRQKVVEQIQEKYPEIVKLDSPIRKHLDQLCADNDLNAFFNTHPNGYYYAANVADLSHRAEMTSALAEEVKSLKTQLKDLQKKSSPATSFDNGGMNPKNVNQLNREDKASYFRRMAEDADRFAGVG